MNWKKNVFSYLMWLLYTVVVGSSLFCVIALLGNEMGYTLPVSLAGGCACFFATGGMVFLLHIIWQKIWQKVRAFFEEREKKLFLTEGIIIVILLVVGIMFTMSNFPKMYAGENYFELAKVTDGQGIRPVIHAASYFYMQFLHMICLFFGNKITVCIAAQLILYIITTVIFYFAVRRMTSVLTAMVVLVFMLLSPSLTQNANILSPNILFLFFYVISLHVIITFLKKNSGSIIKYIITGIVIAFVTYLDVMGLTLLIYVMSIFYVERQKAENKWNNPVLAVFTCVLISVAGFFGFILLDALLSGTEIVRVLNAWGNLYYPGDFHMPAVMYEIEYTWDSVLLLVLLNIGVLGFFFRKKVERLSVWILTTIVFIIMECMQIAISEMNALFYGHICLTVMAGIGVANIFAIENEVKIEEEEQQMPEKEAVVEEKNNEKPTVQFIENPLPLPKKHVSKVMDYDYEVADDDDFDI